MKWRNTRNTLPFLSFPSVIISIGLYNTAFIDITQEPRTEQTDCRRQYILRKELSASAISWTRTRITHADSDRVDSYVTSVRLYVCLIFRIISQKPMQLGLLNLT